MYVLSQIGLLVITTQEKLLQFIISEMYVEQIGPGGRGSREAEVRGSGNKWPSQVRLLQLASGWQHQACFTPLKVDWISYKRSETFPEAGLNLQIVPKHFPSQ